jgi:hypothetical protein
VSKCFNISPHGLLEVADDGSHATSDFVAAEDYCALVAERDALRSRLAEMEKDAVIINNGFNAAVERMEKSEARLAEAERLLTRVNDPRFFIDLRAFLTPADQPTGVATTEDT